MSDRGPQINVRLTLDEKQELERLAAATRLTVTQLVKICIPLGAKVFLEMQQKYLLEK